MKNLPANIFLLTCIFVIESRSVAAASRPYPCNPGDTLKTSLGVTFTCVKYGKFFEAWKAPDGTVWSEGSKAQFENYDQSSPAIQACEQVGGHLASADDYMKLLALFSKDGSYGYGRTLSETEINDLHKVFPDMKRNNFCTSTKESGSSGVTVSGDDGEIYIHRHTSGGRCYVRCISE